MRTNRAYDFLDYFEAFKIVSRNYLVITVREKFNKACPDRLMGNHSPASLQPLVHCYVHVCARSSGFSLVPALGGLRLCGSSLSPGKGPAFCRRQSGPAFLIAHCHLLHPQRRVFPPDTSSEMGGGLLSPFSWFRERVPSLFLLNRELAK